MIANNAETHVLQRAFRNIMNALARPGRLGEVEVLRAGAEEENPLPAHFEVVVKTLVDQAVDLCGFRNAGARSNSVGGP